MSAPQRTGLADPIQRGILAAAFACIATALLQGGLVAMFGPAAGPSAPWLAQLGGALLVADVIYPWLRRLDERRRQEKS